MTELRELPARLGRRGAILLTFGAIWLIVAASIPNEVQPPEDSWLFHVELPVPLRVFLWVFTGLVAMAHAFTSRGAGTDRWGFIALILMPAERSVSYFLGWLASYIEVLEGGYPRGYLPGSVWLLVVTAVLVIAGWPEPDRRSYLPDPRESVR